MRTLPAWIFAGWALAISVSAAPMMDMHYPYWGPAQYQTWPSNGPRHRIDARYWEGYFTPEQMKDIWGTYHQQREQLLAKAKQLYPKNPGAQFHWVEEQLKEKGGPNDQLAAKRDEVTKKKREPDWRKMDESRAVIKKEEAELGAQRKKTLEQLEQAESQRKAKARAKANPQREEQPPKDGDSPKNGDGQRDEDVREKRKAEPKAIPITDGSSLKTAVGNNLNGAKNWFSSVAQDFPGQLAVYRPDLNWATLAPKVPSMGIRSGFRPMVA